MKLRAALLVFLALAAGGFSVEVRAAYPQKIFVWGTVSRMNDHTATLQTKKGKVQIPRSALSKNKTPKPGDPAGAYTTMGQIQIVN